MWNRGCLSLRIMQVVSTLHTVIFYLYRVIQDQKRLEDELWVAINGPEVVHSDSIVREAVEKNGSSFIRRSDNIKSWEHGSKAITSLVSKAPKIPFMV